MTSDVALSGAQPRTIEARRLIELARAAGLGDRPDDALGWHDEALTLLGSAEETPLLADVLRWQGTVHRDRGHTSRALPLYERSLRISAKLGYDSGCAHALNCLGTVAHRRGDLSRAGTLYDDARRIAEQCDETRLVG